MDALGVTDAPVADDAFKVVAVPEAVLEITDPPPTVVAEFPIVLDETAALSVVETDDTPVTIVVGGFDAVVPDAVLPVPPIIVVALVGNEAVLPTGVEERTDLNVVDPPVTIVVGGFDAVLVDTVPVLIVVVPLVIDGVVTEFPAVLLPGIVDPLVTKVEGGFDAVVPDAVLPAPLLTETVAPVVPREDNVIGIRDVRVPGVVIKEPDVVGRIVLGIVKGFEVVTAADAVLPASVLTEAPFVGDIVVEELPAAVDETDAPGVVAPVGEAVVPSDIGSNDVKVPGVVIIELDVVGRSVIGMVEVAGFEVVTDGFKIVVRRVVPGRSEVAEDGVVAPGLVPAGEMAPEVVASLVVPAWVVPAWVVPAGVVVARVVAPAVVAAGVVAAGVVAGGEVTPAVVAGLVVTA
jgi:hypothetical protein